MWIRFKLCNYQKMCSLGNCLNCGVLRSTCADDSLSRARGTRGAALLLEQDTLLSVARAEGQGSSGHVSKFRKGSSVRARGQREHGEEHSWERWSSHLDLVVPGPGTLHLPWAESDECL